MAPDIIQRLKASA